jgi:hypothetical protein
MVGIAEAESVSGFSEALFCGRFATAPVLEALLPPLSIVTLKIDVF